MKVVRAPGHDKSISNISTDMKRPGGFSYNQFHEGISPATAGFFLLMDKLPVSFPVVTLEPLAFQVSRVLCPFVFV